ncbi:type VII secretion protein EsaA [Metabacillus sp. KIGAM252]|uniref:Type VII secretion protein EsaA n=1 Tax=Metabacillus flavus TaxID=2823519 RepID=A0ABS5LJ80_9BACI|nr:type VII secretion protein EsaA [Metabacillus flavus]MBS2970805.1 type VII secretion protein EsaA [Metabacillus flavus]
MTEQTKHMMKMILAVVLILAVPALFFQTIGQNPMEVQDKATRTIAVVNEDNGLPESDEDSFGKLVTAAMSKNSDYEWKALARSGAESEMKNQNVDAIIYIPSDFSTNILTYEETQPAKAEFKFKVQDQLTAVDKEKVLRTIEEATDVANKKTAVYYWDTIAQEMDDVKKKFDQILEKEDQFQKTMVAFYKPSSKDLSGEIESQKQMLQQLQATMLDASKSAPEREQNAEEFQKNLASFVTYVDSYQLYQQNQMELMREVQNQTITGLQASMSNQSQRNSESFQKIDSQVGQINNDMSAIQATLQEGSDNATEIERILQGQMDRQISDLKAVQAQYLDLYEKTMKETTLTELESTMASLRKELQNTPEPGTPGTPAEPGTPTVPETPETPETPNPNPISSLQEQQTALKAVAEQAKQLQESLNKIPDPKPNEAVNAANSLGQLALTANEIEKQLAEKDASNQEWQKKYDQLAKDYEKLLSDNTGILTENQRLREENKRLSDQILSLQGNVQPVIDAVKKKEQAILSDSNLTEERKKTLEPIFQESIQKVTIEPLFAYYAKLDQYESTLKDLNSSDSTEKNTVLANEELNEKMKTALAPTDEEREATDAMQGNFPSAQLEMTRLEESFQTFIADYSGSVADQQTAMMDEITAIQTNADNLMQQLQSGSAPGQPEQAEPSQAPTSGTGLVSGTQSITSTIDQMNSIIDSLGERQTNVLTYTDELYNKVDEVQTKSDELNDKWATNVAATELSRDQVYDVLRNARIDGQDNGFVYDHLANPIQISGEEPIEKAKTVPPVVILVIVLLSSLLIGYFSGVYFKTAPLWLRATLFILLNVIVGLLISVFGTNIYSLADDRAIQWSIFTIVLLLTASSLIRVAYLFNNTTGMLASVALTAYFVSPLLALTVPNFNYSDPISTVYISIQEDANNLFTEGVLVLGGILLILTVIPFIIRAIMDNRASQKEAHEA